LTEGSMRVVELRAHGAPLRITQRPIPTPGPNEVRIRVQACGVCGSDVFLQDGGFGDHPLPIVPGHEAAGVVDEVGAAVHSVEPGSPVALYYISTPPGDQWARRGMPNRSRSLQRMGVDVDGAFAEYVIRPVESLIVPPQELPPAELAVLTDAVATPLHALRRVANVQKGETVAVIGVGGIGSNGIQIARAFGATTIAISRSRAKLELAARLGADHVFRSDATVVKRVLEATDGIGADVVLQCVGTRGCYEMAIQLAAPGGRVVALGSSVEPFGINPMDLIWSERSILGSRGFVPNDIEEAISMRLAGRISLAHLLESLRPLEEAQLALDDLREGRVIRSVLLP
jgi:D-arabinose 1-dehydrogenase-like Zn-dependent alcohol dehydrogenase